MRYQDPKKDVFGAQNHRHVVLEPSVFYFVEALYLPLPDQFVQKAWAEQSNA